MDFEDSCGGGAGGQEVVVEVSTLSSLDFVSEHDISLAKIGLTLTNIGSNSTKFG